MIEINVTAGEIHITALDAALRSVLGSRVIGVSTYGPDRPLSLWLADGAGLGDIEAAQGVVAAHDPVFLSVDRTVINGDGVDEATITVCAPMSGAVILVADGLEVPVRLENGVGQISVSSPDAGMMVWAVKNPANRTTDEVRIEVRNG